MIYGENKSTLGVIVSISTTERRKILCQLYKRPLFDVKNLNVFYCSLQSCGEELSARNQEGSGAVEGVERALFSSNVHKHGYIQQRDHTFVRNPIIALFIDEFFKYLVSL